MIATMLLQRQTPTGSLIENDYTLHITASWLISAVVVGALLVGAWRAYRQARRSSHQEMAAISLKRVAAVDTKALKDDPVAPAAGEKR